MNNCGVPAVRSQFEEVVAHIMRNAKLNTAVIERVCGVQRRRRRIQRERQAVAVCKCKSE